MPLARPGVPGDHELGVVAVQRLRRAPIEVGQALRVGGARPALPLGRTRAAPGCGPAASSGTAISAANHVLPCSSTTRCAARRATRPASRRPARRPWRSRPRGCAKRPRREPARECARQVRAQPLELALLSQVVQSERELALRGVE
jgi:hypothetical protein